MPKRPAFTLVELCIVMAMLVVIAAAAVPALNGRLEAMRQQSLLREWIDVMQRSRQWALDNGEPVRLQVNSTSGMFTAEPLQSKLRILEGCLSSGVQILGATHPLEKNGRIAVTFFDDGTATADSMHVRISNATFQISVDRLTGQIHSERVP